MNEFEFADRYLGEYNVKGAEIIPTFCPFCKGGNHREKYKFALNSENHTYNCKRASCGKKGHFSELCHEFGESLDREKGNYIKPAYVKKTYKPSRAAVLSPSDKVTAYINSRKISSETMKAYGIGTAAEGNIIFPFYRTAEDFTEKKATFIKYRKPQKLPPGESKMWREAGTEPILFGLHLCDPVRKVLYITEGEFDCMILYQASEGMINVVSVPSGTEDFAWIETCDSILKQYDNIAFFGDSDSPGKKMLADISAKLSDKKILIPDFDTYRGCKDANEIFFTKGSEGIEEVLASMKIKPVTGVINLADIRKTDISNIGRVMTGIPALDYATSGMLDGNLTVWTGKRGEGKSSFLNQMAVECVEQGVNVCIYSGESTGEELKSQIDLCSAGRENTLHKPDPETGRPEYYVDDKTERALNGWYDKKIWIYDVDNIETDIDERDGIIDIFTRTYKTYDCRMFIVDNLMTISTRAGAGEVMQVQAGYVVRLRIFAKKYNVHVHVVVHPRKGEVKDSDDIAGLGTITNIACSVFSIRKLQEVSGGYMGTDDDNKPIVVKHNSELKLLKIRKTGDGGDIALNYDKEVRRFTEAGRMPKKYSWLKGLERWETVDEIPDM